MAVPSKAILRDVPNSRLYMIMREQELRIDQFINRKKAEICDVTQPAPVENRYLRMYIFNHYHNQGSTSPNAPPSWSLCIYGHFVEPEQTLLPHVTQQQRMETKKLNRWTEAMSSIEIRVEEQGEGARSPEIVRWERGRHIGAHRECVELHRCGSRNAKVTITMVRDFVPERFTVTGALREVVTAPTVTRGQVLGALWKFVHEHSTPDALDPATVTCDETLVRVLGISGPSRKLQLAAIPALMSNYLKPMEPIVITFFLRVSGPNPTPPNCYDVEVSVPLKESALKLPAMLERIAKDKELQQSNEEVLKVLKVLHDTHHRFQFLSGFAAGPVQFMQRLIAAAAKETRVQQGTDANEYKLVSGAEHYRLPWAQEAVVKYLQKSAGPGA